MSAGSVPTNATEIYQEGLRIPPLKLRDGRRLQRHAGQDDPPERAHPRYGDGRPQCPGRGLHGGGAPAGRARRRLRPQSAGLDLRRAAAAFGDHDPQGARAIPEGTYRFVDYLDNDGIELDKPIRIEVAVTVKGGDIEFDFEGTSPQVQGAAQLRAVRFAGRGVLRRARPHRPHHPDQRRLLPADQAAPAQGHDRQSAGTCRRQRPDIDHQAHHRLHDRRARPDPAGARAGSVGGRAPGDRLRRQPCGRRPLRRRRADRRRQRRQRRPGRRRCHRDRCHELHEPAGRSHGDGGADPRPPGRAAQGFRRRRHVPRRSRRGSRIRDPRRRGVALPSRRAPLLQRPRSRRRVGGRQGPFGHPARRRRRGGHPVEDGHDLAQGRPSRHRDRGRRRIWRSARAARRAGARGCAQRQGQRGSGAFCLRSAGQH